MLVHYWLVDTKGKNLCHLSAKGVFPSRIDGRTGSGGNQPIPIHLEINQPFKTKVAMVVVALESNASHTLQVH